MPDSATKNLSIVPPLSPRHTSPKARPSDDATNIKVAIRFRPPNRETVPLGCSSNFLVQPATAEVIDKIRGLTYAFDAVYNPAASTREVFERSVRGIIDSCVEGFNGTIFAYGQTASGKTYTMQGTPPDQEGIACLAIRDIFRRIHETPAREFKVSVTYIEVYNERLVDLIAETARAEAGSSSSGGGSVLPDDNEISMPAAAQFSPAKEDRISHRELRIVDGPNGLVEVMGSTVAEGRSAEDVIALVTKCEKARHVAGTQLNERSSRSHTVLSLRIESKEFLNVECQANSQVKEKMLSNAPSTSLPLSRYENIRHSTPKPSSRLPGTRLPLRVGLLHLVDLAGSEGVSRAQTEGIKRVEGSNINRSLLALTRVICQIVQRQQQKVDKDDSFRLHITYRESKLTRLLSNSLGGNSKTAIICCCSPDLADYRESVSTLEFAARAKCIRNKAKVNLFVDAQLSLRQQVESENLRLREEVFQLRSDLLEFEKKERGALRDENPQGDGVIPREERRSRKRALAANDDSGKRVRYQGASDSTLSKPPATDVKVESFDTQLRPKLAVSRWTVKITWSMPNHQDISDNMECANSASDRSIVSSCDDLSVSNVPLSNSTDCTYNAGSLPLLVGTQHPVNIRSSFSKCEAHRKVTLLVHIAQRIDYEAYSEPSQTIGNRALEAFGTQSISRLGWHRRVARALRCSFISVSSYPQAVDRASNTTLSFSRNGYRIQKERGTASVSISEKNNAHLVEMATMTTETSPLQLQREMKKLSESYFRERATWVAKFNQMEEVNRGLLTTNARLQQESSALSTKCEMLQNSVNTLHESEKALQLQVEMTNKRIASFQVECDRHINETNMWKTMTEEKERLCEAVRIEASVNLQRLKVDHEAALLSAKQQYESEKEMLRTAYQTKLENLERSQKEEIIGLKQALREEYREKIFKAEEKAYNLESQLSEMEAALQKECLHSQQLNQASKRQAAEFAKESDKHAFLLENNIFLEASLKSAKEAQIALQHALDVAHKERSEALRHISEMEGDYREKNKQLHPKTPTANAIPSNELELLAALQKERMAREEELKEKDRALQEHSQREGQLKATITQKETSLISLDAELCRKETEIQHLQRSDTRMRETLQMTATSLSMVLSELDDLFEYWESVDDDARLRMLKRENFILSCRLYFKHFQYGDWEYSIKIRDSTFKLLDDVMRCCENLILFQSQESGLLGLWITAYFDSMEDQLAALQATETYNEREETAILSVLNAQANTEVAALECEQDEAQTSFRTMSDTLTLSEELILLAQMITRQWKAFVDNATEKSNCLARDVDAAQKKVETIMADYERRLLVEKKLAADREAHLHSLIRESITRTASPSITNSADAAVDTTDLEQVGFVVSPSQDPEKNELKAQLHSVTTELELCQERLAHLMQTVADEKRLMEKREKDAMSLMEVYRLGANTAEAQVTTLQATVAALKEQRNGDVQVQSNLEQRNQELQLAITALKSELETLQKSQARLADRASEAEASSKAPLASTQLQLTARSILKHKAASRDLRPK